MVEAPYCSPPHKELLTPSLALPKNSCDCHVHVFGPAERYPYQTKRAYTPHDCTPDMLFDLHDALGIQRAVIVQASVHGTDNTAILDAVALAPQRLRAVASVSPEVSDRELARLHEGGVRAIRVNMVDKGGMPFKSLDELEAMADRIADMGWHIELLAHVEEVEELPELASRLSVPISVGHFGYTKAALTVAHPGYDRFLGLVREGRCWVKLTAPYRISDEGGVPYSDVRPFADALVRAAPERLIWGSDWPHVMQVKPMPHDAHLLDLLGDWVTDPSIRRMLFVDNPSALYGFDEFAAAKRNSPLVSQSPGLAGEN
ncbi:amidohydrolase family protein [Devosia sp. 919]|uniref:amidohydrolase family protein n=1 Tax=Devosia sp. 919 TaxID=2726065 RepID=UPI001557AF10|nr:amidohydrolase family protein [Devosia sp. 919]